MTAILKITIKPSKLTKFTFQVDFPEIGSMWEVVEMVFGEIKGSILQPVISTPTV